MKRKPKFTAEAQRHKEKSQFELFKPIKPLLKTLRLCVVAVYSFLILTLTLTAYCLLPTTYCFGWSEPVAIDSGPSNAYRTDVVFDKRGNAISVFEQKEGDVYRVFANRYQVTPSPLVGEGWGEGGMRWQGAIAIDSGIGNAYRGQVAFDRKGNAIAVFKQEIAGGKYRIYANRYQVFPSSPLVGEGRGEGGKEGWQGAIPIDNGTGNADGQDIVFDSEGNAAAVFEAKDGEEMGIYVNFYNTNPPQSPFTKSPLVPPLIKGGRGEYRGILGGWSGAFRIDSGSGNAYFPYPLFDDKGNLYVLYYKEESGGLEAYVSSLERGEIALPEPALSEKTRFFADAQNDKGEGARNDKQSNGVIARISRSPERSEGEATKQSKFMERVSTVRISDRNIILKKEKWIDKKSAITRGIKAVYNPIFLGEIKNRIYSGNYSYSRWETPSKLDARFRDAYRPTLLANGKGEMTALFVKWDGEYLSAYTADYRNGKWGKPEEIDSGKGDVEHIRGAVNSEGEVAVIWTQWVDGNLRIHARTRLATHDSQLTTWGDAKIIDAGKKDGYNPSVAFTERGEIVAVWCQWEKTNVKSYVSIYRNEGGWSKAERLENEDGETCGVRIASGPDGKVIAIFEQENGEGRDVRGRLTNRIFAVEYIVNSQSSIVNRQSEKSYTVRKLTSGDREDYYAEFSPDGKMIVFVSKSGKHSNLYVMDANGKSIRQLTSGNVTDTAPVFTSDGKRIIFTSTRTDEGLPPVSSTGQALNDSVRGHVPEGINRGWDIWSINTDGTGLTRLTNDKTNELAPRTTSDGSNIVFVSTAGGDHAIWSMNINGENKKRLTSGGTGDWFPAMNPDGREIVFVSTRLGNGDIWTIDSVEKKYHRLTYTDLPEFSPAWSPDGSKIAYVTNKSGEFDIWIMDRDGKNKRRLTKGISDGNWGSRFSSRKILETAGYYHLSWHPDGTKILFTEWGYDKKESCISVLEFDEKVIDMLEADGTSIPEYTLIGEKELTKGEWEDFAPSFSPDGTSLTFSSNRGGNWDIWSMEFNGEDLKQLTKGADDELAPVYSPDGKEIAFLKISNFKFQISNYDLWIMKSDGSGARQVTKNIPIISYPAWNPNGREIAFVARGEDGTEIWTYNIHDSRLTTHNSQLTTHGSQLTAHNPQNYPFKEFLYRIGYNPSGDKITFESNSSGNVEIWTMRSDGTNLTCITKGDSPHWNPIWSPDGKMIAYASDKLGDEAGLHNWRNYNIWIANPETQKEMLITGEEQIDWNPVWSPDGKKIVYVTNRSGDFKHFSLWVLYLK